MSPTRLPRRRAGTSARKVSIPGRTTALADRSTARASAAPALSGALSEAAPRTQPAQTRTKKATDLMIARGRGKGAEAPRAAPGGSALIPPGGLRRQHLHHDLV